MSEIQTSGAGVFVASQTNITEAELNAIIANAIIQTSFYSGKAAASANPAKATHYILLLDASGVTPVFKVATLQAGIFDSSEFLQARTSKATPVAADTILIGDSAASGVPKQSTVQAILFGATAHTAPIAADLIGIFNSTGGLIGTITLGNLINQLVSHTAPVAGDALMVREAGGAERSLTLLNLVNGLAAEAAPAGAMKIAITDGVTVKNVALATLISGLAATLVTPAGTELIQVNDAGTLKKMLLSDLRNYSNQPYLVYTDVKAAGTAGGAFNSGAWQTRTLNTEAVDAAAIGSIAANQITLPAGTYRARITAPGNRVFRHQAKLYNVTDAADTLIGTSAYAADTTDGPTTHSIITGRFTIAGAKVFEVRHQCSSSKATDGFGVASNFGVSETYTVAEFWKE